MDHDPFQTVNDRRTTLSRHPSQASHTSSGFTTSSASNFGLLQQTAGRTLSPNTPPHPSVSFTSPSTVSRGLYCRNWRASTASLDSLVFPSSTALSAGASSSSSASCSTNIQNNFATTSGGGILSSPVSPGGFGSNLSNSSNHSQNHNSNSNNILGSNGYLSIANLADSSYPTLHGLHNLNDNRLDPITSTSNTANMRPSNGSFIAEADMDKAMAYCYDRGDGQYTRLVAVDLLPIDLQDIPRRVASDEGMIVLPIPRMSGPNGQPADNQLEVRAVVTVSRFGIDESHLLVGEGGGGRCHGGGACHQHGHMKMVMQISYLGKVGLT